MNVNAFLQSLEEVQKQIALPMNEKEAQIANLVNSERGSGGISEFLTFLIHSQHGHRLLHILEQYPIVYGQLLDDANLSSLLRDRTVLTDVQILGDMLSIVSIALTIRKQDNPESLLRISFADLIEFCLNCVQVDDLAISDKAATLLESLAQVFGESMQDMFRLMEQLLSLALFHMANSTILMRYMAISVSLCKKSEIAARAFVDAKLLNFVYEICRSDDLLAAINVFDYVCEITKGPGSNVILSVLSHPMASVSDSAVVNPPPIVWFSSLCKEHDNPKFDPFLRDNAMRTLISIFDSAVKSGYGFMDVNFSLLVEVSTELLEDRAAGIESRLAGLGVISDLAQLSSYWFQQVLFPAHDPSLRTLSAWMSLLHTGKSELVGAGLFAIAHALLRPDDVYVAASANSAPASDASNIPNAMQMAELKRRLVSTIGIARNSTTLKFLINTARQPVSPLRIAAIDVMHALVAQPWGLALLVPEIALGGQGLSTSSISLSEFLQYLIDRSTEIDKEGKDAKFELVMSVKQCPSFSLLSTDTQGIIDRMIAQGPYYMPAMLAEMQTL